MGTLCPREPNGLHALYTAAMRTRSQDQQNGIVTRGRSVHRTRARPKLGIQIDNSNRNHSEYVDLPDQQRTPSNQMGAGKPSPGKSTSFQGANQDTEWIPVKETGLPPLQEEWKRSRPTIGVEAVFQQIRIASALLRHLEEWTPTLQGTLRS